MGSDGSSVLDYCVVDLVVFDRFSSFRVNSPNTLADHCLVDFFKFTNEIIAIKLNSWKECQQIHLKPT